MNTASFLASTLNILDEDFLNETYRFYVEKGYEKSKIVNEGSISSPEGSIAFAAPVIENRGSITARAGKVALASAERVTLDFTGDGLVRISVDETLNKLSSRIMDRLKRRKEMSKYRCEQHGTQSKLS